MATEIEQEDPHPDFVKGFNEGYLLAKYAPEVGQLFGAYAPGTERGQGFRKGKEQLALEQDKDRYPDYLKDASDNKMDIGLKDSPEKKIEDFKENKSDQGLDRHSYPSWLLDKDDNKADMELDREQELDRGDIEPDID